VHTNNITDVGHLSKKLTTETINLNVNSIADVGNRSKKLTTETINLNPFR